VEVRIDVQGATPVIVIWADAAKAAGVDLNKLVNPGGLVQIFACGVGSWQKLLGRIAGTLRRRENANVRL